MSTQKDSHARQNILTGDWVLVSPHRTLRPWQGQIEIPEVSARVRHDPNCYLCPGNLRVNGARNPDYTGTFAFDNDFSALSATSNVEIPANALFRARSEYGRCRVLCYTEQHDVQLSTMSVHEITRVLDAMTAEFCDLERSHDFAYVQIFENRGQMMGCSNPHPHAQIWATQNVPNEPGKEFIQQRDYFRNNESPLLLDYLDAELRIGERVVVKNEHYVAVVPFWAIWPFELLILPRRRIASPDEMRDDEIRGLAAVLHRVLGAYDRMFESTIPYSLGFHPRPLDGDEHAEWVFHAHVYPPLLRSATVKKHLVGFDMLGMPQRDLTPEVAAGRLRAFVTEATR